MNRSPERSVANYLLKNLEIELKSLLEDYTLYELIDELALLNLNVIELDEEIFEQYTEKTSLQKKIYSLIK